MRRFPISGLVLATLLPGISPAEEKITYEDHILPIFQQSCLNCHNPDKNKGGLDLSSFAGAMKGSSGGKVVEPGDTGSKLLASVMQTNDKKMPPEGDKLGADKITLLKAWIEGGLLETKSSTARKPSKPKFDTALAASSAGKPDGPPPMPADVLLEPVAVASRAAPPHAMIASPWAPLLAITGQHQVLLVDTNTLELAGILPFPEGDPVSLCFTPNARYLIVGGGVPGKSGLTVTFDVTTGERMLVAAKEFDTVLAADLTPDLSTVATGSPSRLVKMWKAEDGSQIRSIKKHTDWVTALDFSPDGILLASGDRNGGVWVWETGSGNEFQTLRAHQAAITALSFRADSNLLASASEDGTVRFWEMNGGTEVKKLDAHPGGVLSFSWFHDGSFVTCGRDHAIRIWKPDFNLLREIKDQPDIQVAATCDFESKRVFAADYRGQILVWDLATGNAAGKVELNPPAIATRLSQLNDEIGKQPALITSAEQAVQVAATHREETAKQITTLEAGLNDSRAAFAAIQKIAQETPPHIEQLQQEQGRREPELSSAREAVKASAQSGQQLQTVATTGGPEDPATRLARLEAEFSDLATRVVQAKAALNEASQKMPACETRTKELEASLTKAREEMPAAEKSAADANSALETLRQQGSALESQRHHWQAAAINADYLRSKAAAEHQSAEAESLTAEYNELLKETKTDRAHLDELQKKLPELEAAQPADEAAQKAIAEAKEQIAQLTKKKAPAPEELEARKAKMDAAISAAASLKEETAQLHSRYASLRDGK